jgi:hypothetical protein
MICYIELQILLEFNEINYASTAHLIGVQVANYRLPIDLSQDWVHDLFRGT